MDDDDLRPSRSVVDRLARLEERSTTFLDSDDAIKLMEHAGTGDAKLREDFVSRIHDFRVEVREAFKHGEKEYAAALFKSNTEYEGRMKTELEGIKTQLGTMTTALAAIADRPTGRGGWHPIATYGGTSVAISIIWIIAYMLGFKPPGFQ